MTTKQPADLDPTDPRDALTLLTLVTGPLAGTREDHRRLSLALDTLARLIPTTWTQPPPSNVSPE